MDLESGVYLIPAGDGSSAPLQLDLVKVAHAKGRLHEVEGVNMAKAPELLATYNDCWLDLSKAVALLTSEKLKAEDAVRRARAMAVLSYTDEHVKSKGFAKSSADLRESMVELDDGVCSSRDRLLNIKLVLDYLNDLRQGFENAYTAVKKLISGPQPFAGNPSSPGEDHPFHKEGFANGSASYGFGTPRYTR